ncbi:MAG TPA: hypothetical protein VNS19_10135 [Acidimicrobiales bacterium]|nr:hypothetical protein [Acidimicrobiales bacterium]
MKPTSAIAAGLLLIAAGSIIGTVVLAQPGEERASRPVFGLSPEPGSDEPAPAFSAVTDGAGGIAGYVNTELFESGGPQPDTPEEAVAFTKSIKGNIYEVFDTKGEIVGYFASEGHGFVDEAEKDRLLEAGFRFLRSAKPDLKGGARPSVEPGDATPSPSTPGS